MARLLRVQYEGAIYHVTIRGNEQTAYTVYFNLRHNRTGHLMQGRFGSKLVEGDEYLLKLSRYVHLNPVFVGSVKKLPLKEKTAYLRWRSKSSVNPV